MKKITVSGLLIVLVAAGLSGCSVKSSVQLNYQPAGINMTDCDKSIAVVELVDQRGEEAVGKTNEGKLFYGEKSVAEWISKALYEELTNGGCRAQYHEKEYDFDTDYILIGAIQEVFVTQASLTKYNARMQLKIVLKSGDQQVFERQFSSNYSKRTVFSPGVNSKVLTEVLQGMMKEVVPEVRNHMQ